MSRKVPYGRSCHWRSGQRTAFPVSTSGHMNSRYFNHPFNPACWSRPVFLLIALATSLAAANNYYVRNLVSDLPGVADQEDDGLANPWDFVSFPGCAPASPSCTPPNVSSVLIATNGNATVLQYTPIPGIVQPESYPSLLPGVTGIMGIYGLPQNDLGVVGASSNIRHHAGR